MKLHEKIYTLRKKQNLSQEALSEKLGVSRQSVSKWETGEATPEVTKLLSLSKIFGVTTDYLLNDESEDEVKIIEVKEEPSAFAATPIYETPRKNNSAKKLAIILLICIIAFALLFPLFIGIFGYSVFTNKTDNIVVLEGVTSVEADEYFVPRMEADESLYYGDDTTSIPYETDGEPIVRFENSAVAESSTSITNFSVILIILLFGIPALMIPILIIAIIVILIKRKKRS